MPNHCLGPTGYICGTFFVFFSEKSCIRHIQIQSYYYVNLPPMMVDKKIQRVAASSDW